MLNCLPIIATLLVAAAAAVLAAVATSTQALRVGAVNNVYLAALLPVIIEGGACVAAVLAYRRSALGVSALPERATLCALAAIATAANVSHVSTHAPLAYVLAACPPLVLITALELVFRWSALTAERPSEALTAPVIAPAPAPVAGEAQEKPSAPISRPLTPADLPVPAETPQAAVETPTPERAVGVLSPAERVAQIARWHEAGERLTGPIIAERFRIAGPTARRDLASFRASLSAVGASA